MTQVTIQGRQYSDDGTTARDMLNGGHRLHFFPLVQDIVATAADVAADEAAAAISATNAANSAASTQGTSSTSNTVGSGSKTWTTQANKQFAIGSMLTVSRTSAPATLMHGQVTAYNSTTGSLTVNVSNFSGSGTYTDWTIALSGIAGPTGATGNGSVGYLSLTGSYTVTATDRAKIIDCNGTFTLSFQAAATLGANWVSTVRNIGTGIITLDPNASETINGATTYLLYPGEIVNIQTDGTLLRTVFQSVTPFRKLPILSTVSASRLGVTSGENIHSAIAAYNTITQVLSLANNGTTIVASAFASVSNVESSTDGVTWVNRTMTTAGYWNIFHAGTRFVGIAGNATTVNVSTDGITWSPGTSLPGTSVISSSGMAYGAGILLVTPSSGSSIYRSADAGASWTTQTTPANLGYIVYSGGLFVGQTTASGGTTYYTSSTGLTGSWTTRTLPGGRTTLHVLSDGTLVCFTNNSTTLSIMTSSDGGVNWSDTGVTFPFEINSLDKINDVWIFVKNVSPSFDTVTKHINYVNRTSIGSQPMNVKGFTKMGNIYLYATRVINPTVLSSGVFA